MSVMIAARPLMPSRSRSSLSSSASSASSGIASTRPAPNNGIGTRRAITFASGGMIGWHVCVGIEKIWNREPDVGTSSWNSPFSSRRAARTSATTPAPPIDGTL
jgi:hypothetical protein